MQRKSEESLIEILTVTLFYDKIIDGEEFGPKGGPMKLFSKKMFLAALIVAAGILVQGCQTNVYVDHTTVLSAKGSSRGYYGHAYSRPEGCYRHPKACEMGRYEVAKLMASLPSDFYLRREEWGRLGWSAKQAGYWNYKWAPLSSGGDEQWVPIAYYPQANFITKFPKVAHCRLEGGDGGTYTYLPGGGTVPHPFVYLCRDVDR